MTLGIYIHWPFCRRICPYCDFNVRRWRGEEEAGLLGAICADIAEHGRRLGPQRLHSVHFGGGTPSMLAPQAIARILDSVAGAFGLEDAVEIGLEANPEDAGVLPELVGAGINRLSLGVQALDDAALGQLGRGHTADAALEAIEVAARTAARVSVDLIHSRPGQTLAAWEAELRRALRLEIEHLSAYQLTIEAGTPFAKAAGSGRLLPQETEQAAQFYELTQALCAEAGFCGYEISNHAKGDSARARHNLLYWRGNDWLGVGPGAHGRIALAGQRTATTAWRGLKDYANAVAHAGVGWESTEALAAEAEGEEMLLMGLRLAEGVDVQRVERLLGRPLSSAGLMQSGLVHALRPGRLALTLPGRLFADRIAVQLLAGEAPGAL